jgi:hypothetical protein
MSNKASSCDRCFFNHILFQIDKRGLSFTFVHLILWALRFQLVYAAEELRFGLNRLHNTQRGADMAEIQTLSHFHLIIPDLT